MKKILLLFVSIIISVSAYAAEWEMLHEQNAAYGFYITQEGVMLLSDYDDFTKAGGIFYSEDNGLSWEKSNAKNFYYSKFIEAGDYIYAVGYSCRVARSEDGGRTWDILNYNRALNGLPYASLDNFNSSAAYGIVYHNGRLYVSDFSFGVVASDDWGETWTSVDAESMMQDVDDGGKGGGKMIENLYMLSEYNGTLLAHGLYNVYAFNDETQKWSYLTWSNCMAVYTVFNGKYFAGRSMPNDDFNSPFLLGTSDLKNWTNISHPSNEMSTNVRALTSDGARIYAAIQFGAVYMTSDEGETWYNISAGLPHIVDPYTNKESDAYYSVLQLCPSKDYLYAVVYNEPWNEFQHTSGLYRIKMSDLEEINPTGIQSTMLRATSAENYDLQGRRVNNAAAKGLYIVGDKKIIK